MRAPAHTWRLQDPQLLCWPPRSLPSPPFCTQPAFVKCKVGYISPFHKVFGVSPLLFGQRLEFRVGHTGPAWYGPPASQATSEGLALCPTPCMPVTFPIPECPNVISLICDLAKTVASSWNVHPTCWCRLRHSFHRKLPCSLILPLGQAYTWNTRCTPDSVAEVG